MGYGFGFGTWRRRGAEWSPASLFVPGDVGLWYDPSDLTTQFQDHVGTTPVTADGQSVGLVLDKGSWGGMSTAQMLALYATSNPLALPGRHLIQPVEASKPKYQTAVGLHWWLLDGSNDGWYTSSSFAWGSDKAAFAGGLYRGTAAGVLQVFAEFSPAAPESVGGWLVVEDVQNSVPWGTYAKGTAAISLSQLSKITGPINTFESIVGNMDIAGDLSRIWKNGVKGIDGTGDKGAGNFGAFQFYVGRRNNSLYPANCRISDIIARNRLWTDDERARIDLYVTRRAGIAAPLVVGDGASGMRGYGSADPVTQSPLAQMDLPGWTKINLAVDGTTTVQRSGSASNPTIFYNPLRAKNVAVLWEASNHIYFGATASEAITAYVAWCNSVRASGFKVVCVTVLPRSAGSPPPTFEASRQTFNGYLRANWSSFSDGLADIAADPRIGDAGDEYDTTYYPDLAHLNATGYGIVAGIMRQAVLSV